MRADPKPLLNNVCSMSAVSYRQASKSDIPAIARMRSAEWGEENYWRNRITGYMDCELHPQHALKPRVVYVALKADSMMGFIAGHLTRRYGCDGELEWISVIRTSRGSAAAFELLRMLAAWFAEHKAQRICVDVDPKNAAARRFYTKHGAHELNSHWLVWDDISVVLAS